MNCDHFSRLLELCQTRTFPIEGINDPSDNNQAVLMGTHMYPDYLLERYQRRIYKIPNDVNKPEEELLDGRTGIFLPRMADFIGDFRFEDERVSEELIPVIQEILDNQSQLPILVTDLILTYYQLPIEVMDFEIEASYDFHEACYQSRDPTAWYPIACFGRNKLKFNRPADYLKLTADVIFIDKHSELVMHCCSRLNNYCSDKCLEKFCQTK